MVMLSSCRYLTRSLPGHVRDSIHLFIHPAVIHHEFIMDLHGFSALSSKALTSVGDRSDSEQLRPAPPPIQPLGMPLPPLLPGRASRGSQESAA